MKEHKLQVSLNGVELNVAFTFYRGRDQTALEPSEPAELEVSEVYLLNSTADIVCIFSDEVMAELESRCFEAMRSKAEDEADARGDYLYDLAKDEG